LFRHRQSRRRSLSPCACGSHTSRAHHYTSSTRSFPACSPGHTMALPDTSRCAMRGSCGSKGWFGQQLPCPYDGPPVEVCNFAFLRGQANQPSVCLSPRTNMLGISSSLFAVPSTQKDQLVVPQTKSKPYEILWHKQNFSFHPARPVATISGRFSARLLVHHSSVSSWM